MCCLFNETATTAIYTYLHTLSLHDALPISLEKLGTEISLGARRRSLDKANPDEEQGVRFLDDLELACATRAQLLVSDEKLSIPPTECRSIDDVRERKPMLALPGEMQIGRAHV